MILIDFSFIRIIHYFILTIAANFQNFLNNFQAAQLAIKDASAAAAEAAKTNIKDVQERAARIELAVKLKVSFRLRMKCLFQRFLGY